MIRPHNIFKAERFTTFKLDGTSYRRNPFTFCHKLNDMVKSGRETLPSIRFKVKDDSEKYHDNGRARGLFILPLILKSPEPEKIKNTNCNKPFLAIRKWKHWVMTSQHLWWHKKKCYKCTFYIPQNTMTVIDGLYVFGKIVRLVDKFADNSIDRFIFGKNKINKK